MIRPDGKKKAYVRLDAGADSLSLANKIGIIWFYYINNWKYFLAKFLKYKWYF